MKRLAALLIMPLLLNCMTTIRAETLREDIIESEYTFKADFESGKDAYIGNLSGTNIERYITADGQAVLKANATSGTARLTVETKNPTLCEASLISFDVNADKAVARGYMEVHGVGEKATTNPNEMHRAWYLQDTGKIAYFSSFMPPSGAAVASALKYEENKWYHLDLWVDYKEKLVYYYVDGTEIGQLGITEDFKGISGFRFTIENRNGGANYLFDNIAVIDFPARGAKIDIPNVAIPHGFDKPISIKYPPGKNNLGFNFTGLTAAFCAELENVRDCDYDLLLKSTVKNDENQIVGENSREIHMERQAKRDEKIYFSLKRYGFYTIETVVFNKNNGEEISRIQTRFAVLNTPDDGVVNPKMGINDHTTAGHGTDEIERKLKLLSDVGTGTIREGYASISIGTDSTSYEFTDIYSNCAKLLSENGETLMIALSSGKYPPITPEDYAQWEKYVSAVAEQLKGQRVMFEVWNEYNIPGFNYNNATTADYVKLLKSTYTTVKSILPHAKVCGFAAAPAIKPSYDVSAVEWIEEILKLGGGEYMDMASIHPYTTNAPEDFQSDRGRILSQVRKLLDAYGYEDMEMVASEMGWSTASHTDEIGQAKYIVRYACLTYDDFERIIWYVSQNKQTESASENGFGFMHAWSKSWSGDNPPYMAKPALLSFANYNALMTGAVSDGTVDMKSSDTYAYKYTLPTGKKALVVWNADEKEETIGMNIDADSVTMYDLYGNPTELSALDGTYTFDISGSPVYIIGNYTDCSKSEPKFLNLTEKLTITRNDEASISYENESGAGVKAVLGLPANLSEIESNGTAIKIKSGESAEEHEKIHIKIADEKSGAVYYSYSVPVDYKQNVTCSVQPYYYRNGRWQCLMEVKNNTYSQTISGRIRINAPKELADNGKTLEFKNLLPQDSKLMFINVPDKFAGERCNIQYDILLNGGELIESAECSAYMTAIVKIEQPPKIDGKLDCAEWNKQMPLVINNAGQVQRIPNWRGPDDLSGKVYCAYDSENFYIAAEVRDNFLGDKDEKERVWACDSIQFAFAKNNITGMARTEYGIAQVNGKSKIDRYSFMGVDEGMIGFVDVNSYGGAELKVSRDGGVTVYEAKFPWEQIYGERIDVSKTDQVFFSILINENDGAGRIGWMEYCGGIGLAKDAGQFIPLKLQK